LNTVLPPEPEFGVALPLGQFHPAVLEFLARRRSASAGTLCAPAPNAGQLHDILRLAARVPDHGKLAPWRFMIFDGADKAAFVAKLEAIAASRADNDKLIGALFKIRQPPLTVAVISHTRQNKIPVWEQELSSGAVCMNLLLAAQAMGFGANWITDWYAYDREVDAILGLAQGERVAGYIHLGTAGEAPQERVRPDLGAIVSHWTAR
jgi:nitroreductase